MPYEHLPDEGFLIQLCLNFRPFIIGGETGGITTVKRYVDQELIELWRHAVMGIVTGSLIPRHSSYDGRYWYLIDDTHRIYTTEQGLRPSSEIANRIVQFLSQPYSRKQADKLLADIAPKNVSFPNARYVKQDDFGMKGVIRR